MEQNSLSNFGTKLPKDPSCEIISKSVHRFSRSCLKAFILFIALAAILFNGAEPLNNFGRELAKEHFCEIISKSVHRFSRRKLSSIYSPGGHFVQQSRTV